MGATFLTLQQELAAQVGLDSTGTSQATLLKRWINSAQATVLRSFEWPFNRASNPLVIQTATDYTTGTVSTTAGSTTVTFSGTIASSMAGRFLQTSSSNDWYRVTAHTAGTNTATIEIAALYDNATATYTLRKAYYSTSSAVDRILQVTQSILPYQLIETGLEYFQAFNPGFLSTGTPRIYVMAGVDSSGYPQFRLWPVPDAKINLYVDYLIVPVDMSADANESVIPDKWRLDVLIEGAKCQAYGFLDDTRSAESYVKFHKIIDDMKSEYEIGLKRHRVMTASDNQPVGGNLGYMPLPFNYPRGY